MADWLCEYMADDMDRVLTANGGRWTVLLSRSVGSSGDCESRQAINPRRTLARQRRFESRLSRIDCSKHASRVDKTVETGVQFIESNIEEPALGIV